jgi:hypothetical protein
MLEFHKTTNEDGEVLILLTHNRFVWPSGVGTVIECPDWLPTNKCGNGLRGWPWGFGLGDGCDYDIIDDVWLVIGCKPEDVVGELKGGAKCKFRRGIIRLEGSFGDAMNAMKVGFAKCVEESAANGDYAKSAANGDYTLAVVLGHGGRVKVGNRGAFALGCYSEKDGWRFFCGKPGENGIKKDTWYCVLNGNLVECDSQNE